MRGRVLAIGGLVVAALVAVVAARRCASSGTSEVATTRSDRLAGAAGRAPSRSADPSARPAELRPRPLRMRSSDAGPSATPPLRARFDSEGVDPDWAREHEKKVREVLDSLVEAVAGAVETPAVECRSAHCRIEVKSEDQAAFYAFVESMQDERGFYGVADQLMLEALETPASGGGGGSFAITAFVKFGPGGSPQPTSPRRQEE